MAAVPEAIRYLQAHWGTISLTFDGTDWTVAPNGRHPIGRGTTARAALRAALRYSGD